MYTALSLFVISACFSQSAVSPWTLPPKAIVDAFEASTFSAHGTKYHYRLFRPNGQDALDRPLVIWLHGHGDDEILNENVGQLKYIELLIGDDPSAITFPGYILALQCPHNRRWITFQGDRDEPATVVMELARDVVGRFPIDPNRVYLLGISSGGTAAWEIGMRHPAFVAAVTTFGANGGDITRAHELRNTAIWAFHSRHDLFPPPACDRAMYAAVKQFNSDAKYTEPDLATHDCWTVAFEEHGATQWLLSQRKPGKSWKEVGVIAGSVGAIVGSAIASGLALVRVRRHGCRRS